MSSLLPDDVFIYSSDAFKLTVIEKNSTHTLIDVNFHASSLTKVNYEATNKIFGDFLFRLIFDRFHEIADGMRIITPKPSNFLHQWSNVTYSDDRIIINFDLIDCVLTNIISVLEKISTDFKNEVIPFEIYMKKVHDQIVLRDLVVKDGLAFIADGSLLARSDRYSDDPLQTAIPFQSPESLAREFELPYSGIIRGMMIPRGVTVITGGGFHGKSTLLRALAAGIVNKIPGDGREFVVMDSSAISIRAEDGRCVGGLDVSPFIGTLPDVVRINPNNFSTTCASGSTSQAANIMEALEAEAKALLLDEDTCAANFMVRDSRMRSMVPAEPITPFIYRVNALWKEHGVSTVVVIGGCGDWFDVQDTTLLLENYSCFDATKKAASISRTFSHGRVQYNGRGLVHQLPWPWPHLCLSRYLVLPHCLRSSVPNNTPCSSSPLEDDGDCSSVVGPTQSGLLFPFHVSEAGLHVTIGPLLSVDLSRVELTAGSSGGSGSGAAVARGIGLALMWILSFVLAQPPSDIGKSDCECKCDDIVSELSVVELLHRLDSDLQERGIVCLAELDSREREIFVLPRRHDVAIAINRMKGVSFVYKNKKALNK